MKADWRVLKRTGTLHHFPNILTARELSFRATCGVIAWRDGLTIAHGGERVCRRCGASRSKPEGT